MPNGTSQTHEYLINYTTTYAGAGAQEAEADVRRVGEAAGVTQTRLLGFGEATSTTTAGLRATAEGSREVAAGIDETGKAARRSGHWLGRYIQRYLVRYLVVWQGMIALKTGIRDWTQAHEDLDRALFSLQTTMGMTTTQAERYMATMRGMGQIAGVPAAQMAMSGLGAAGGMAGQFGAMAGMGAGEGVRFFGGIQQQYGLGAGQMEELIPRMWAAFAKSGEDIQSWLKDWQEHINALGDGSDAIAEWTRALGIYETTGMRATDRVSAAWSDFLAVLGNTQPITDAKNEWADFFNHLARQVAYGELTPAAQKAAQARYTAATGERGEILGLPRGDFQTWFAREGMVGAIPSMGGGGVGGGAVAGGGAEAGGIGGRFIDSVEIMTRAQFRQMDRLTQQHEESMAAQGIESTLTTLQVAILTEQGYIFKSIDTNVLATALAASEMNERQKTAVYNWPGNAQGVMIGRGSMGTTEFRRRGDEPAPPPYDPLGSTTPYIPGSGIGPFGWSAFQHGGEVRETGPAIVHKGEKIIPVGGAGVGGNLNLQSNLYIDGRLVARNSSQIMGDQLLQAQRASGGQIGALV